MKHTEELMVMTAHASGMSFEKADFAHLYKNRDFLAQEYVRGRMVFGGTCTCFRIIYFSRKLRDNS